jgi:hypothetical protein
MRTKTYNSQRIRLPNGTNAGIYNFNKVLDADFANCTAVGVVVTSNGGNTSFKVGLRASGREILPVANHKVVAFSDNISSSERLLEIDFPSRNETVTTSVEITNTLSF